jgi:MFS family permease
MRHHRSIVVGQLDWPNVWRRSPLQGRLLESIRRRPLLVEVFLVLGLTSVAGVAFGRSLHAGALYDEGVYLASLDALEHGQKLGSQVFASQPPGLYVLLEAERAVFGGSLIAIRVAMLVLALVGCVSAYFIGRRLAGRRGGFFAMGLLVTPVSLEDEAVRVRGDFPSMALSLVAIALALDAVERKGAARLVAAAFAGGALAAAVSVKLLAATAIIPVLAIVWRHGRWTAAALATGVGAVVATLLGLYAGVLGQLWADVVRFHLSAESASIRGTPTSLAGNVAKVAQTVTEGRGPRSPFLWLLVVGALATLLAWRRRRLLGALPLWLWAACAGVFLILHRPLWSHDVTALIVSLAVAGGVGLTALLVEPRPVSRALAATCALVIAASIANHAQRPSVGESNGIKWAVTVLRTRTPAGSDVASDLPIIPFLAHRRQPATLVDTSTTRIGSGWLTRSQILSALDRARVTAVVVGNNFALDPKLLQAIRRSFPLVLSRQDVRIPGQKKRVSLQIYLPRRSAAPVAKRV